MKNPYIVDRPLTERDFYCDRDGSFEDLGDSLGQGRRLFLLYGRDRIGKTSFLNQLPVRLSRYRVCQVEWTVLPGDLPPSRWAAVLGMAKSMGQPLPDPATCSSGDADYARACVESLFALAEQLSPTLVCFDAVPAAQFVPDWGWDQALAMLSCVLGESHRPAVLFCVEGRPEEFSVERPAAYQIVLGGLSVGQTEDILLTPVHGSLSYDYDAVRNIHHLSGGEPYLVQLFGSALFERCSGMGWVGPLEVERAVDQVAARADTQFKARWETCSLAARIVLCVFSKQVGSHGIAMPKDIALYLARLRLRVPLTDIVSALSELVTRDILERLGGETFRFRSELFRRWIKGNTDPFEIVRRTGRYHQLRERRSSSWRRGRVDWLSLVLWLVAGLLIFLIAFVWRSRDTDVTWTSEPTPSQAATGVPTIAAAALPTTEKGVAPGHIVYMARENLESKWTIYVMRSDGTDPLRLTSQQANDTMPVWAPDGRRIAFVSDRDGNREIYVMNSDGNEQLNLTLGPSEDWTPTWSPDGQRIAFSSLRDDNWEIYVMDADGANQKRLTRVAAADYSPSWSPDGQRIAFVSERDRNLEIYLMDAEGGQQTRFTDEAATDQSPVWSADGTELLWESYRDGNMEIYAAGVDGSNLRNLSQDDYADDHGPTCSPWGDRIAFFTNRDRGWDICTLDLATGERANLTLSPMIEQSPFWGR